MTAFERELQINRAAWNKLRSSARRSHRGKFVALAGGEIIASGLDYETVEARVLRQAPGARHFAIFRVESEPIWGIVKR